MSRCAWQGCERPKVRGHGAKYCLQHRRVAQRNERMRKARAARAADAKAAARRQAERFRERRQEELEMKEMARGVRAMLRAFQLI